jgi:hypothetical protein
MRHSQYTFSSGARMCLNLSLFAIPFSVAGAYLTVCWLCLHLGTLAGQTVYPEQFGATLATITFILARVALVLWLTQLGNAARLAELLVAKARRAIYQRSLSAAAA